MIRRSAIALMLLSLVAVAPAMAELKVGVVNPARILNEIQETKAANTDFIKQQEDLKKAAGEKQSQIQGQLQKIAADKAVLKSDSAQYAELSKQELQLSTELQIWAKLAEQDMIRKFKDQARKISDKIKAAVSEVAKAKGLDLVLADQSDLKEDEIDRVPPQNLMPVLLSKNIFYRNDALDITQEVIARLDAGYKK